MGGRLVERRHYQSGVLSETETHTWGADGNLASVAFTGGSRDGLHVEYRHDASGTLVGRRVHRPADEQVYSDENFLVDGLNPTGTSQIVAVVDAQSGQPVRFTTIGLQPESESQANGSGRSFLMADALGSVRGATDPGSGLPATATDFAAFGSPLAPGGGSPLTPGAAALAAPLSRAFAGEQRDLLTGLQNHRARWLDPGLGAWTSPDRVFDFPNNFGSERAYAGLDPVNNTDPFGTFTLLETSIVAALQGLITSFIAGTFCEALIKAFFVAAGIDPSFLLDPVVGFMCNLFDMTPAFDEVARIFEEFTGGLELPLEEYMEPFKQAAETIQFVYLLFTIIIDAVDILGELIQLAVSRSLKNAIELITETIDLVIELIALLETLFPDEEEGEPEPQSAVGGGGKESSAGAAPVRMASRNLKIGNQGEAKIQAMLEDLGIKTWMFFRNNSGNGIDIVARAKNRAGNPFGPFFFFEVKTSKNGKGFRLTKMQSKREAYIRKLITEARTTGKVRKKKPHEKMDEEGGLEIFAERITKANGGVKNFSSYGFVARVNLRDRLPPRGPRIRFYRWIDEEGGNGIGEPIWDSKKKNEYGEVPKFSPP